MKKNEKTDEFLIRFATIERLIAEGWKRENIRIEIPMSTNSSGGRADIVCLDDQYAACVELKSGKDTLENDLLSAQMRQYERSFDYCAVIADNDLYKCVKTETLNRLWGDDNFRNVTLAFRHDWINMKGVFMEQPKKGMGGTVPPAVENISPILFPRHHAWRRGSGTTSVIDMASVLWADELRKILGKGTKCSLEQKAREEMSTKQFRPLFIKALRDRPMNEWEIAFWKRFDSDDMADPVKYLMQRIS